MNNLTENPVKSDSTTLRVKCLKSLWRAVCKAIVLISVILTAEVLGVLAFTGQIDKIFLLQSLKGLVTIAMIGIIFPALFGCFDAMKNFKEN